MARGGVDEYLFTLDHQTTSFGVTKPGTGTVPVSRSMADDDGKVYVFAYYDNDDDNVAGNTYQFINGRIDTDGDGVITTSDDRAKATALTTEAGVDDLVNVGIIDGKIDTDLNNGAGNTAEYGKINTFDDLSVSTQDNAYYQIIDGILYTAPTGDSPVSIGNNTATTGNNQGAAIKLDDGLADVDGSGTADGSDDRNITTGQNNDVVTSNSDLVEATISDGSFDINDDGDIDGADDYAVTGTEYLIIDGRFWSPYTGEQPTNNNGNFLPNSHNEDQYNLDSGLHVPFKPGRTGHFAGFGPKDTVPADIIVTVQFLGSPSLGSDKDDDGKIDDTEVRSKIVGSSSGATPTEVVDGKEKTHTIASNVTQATVTATVEDEFGNPIEDKQVTFTITSEPVDVVASTPIEKTNDAGLATRTISGLPTNTAFKVTVKVTVDGVNLGTVIIAKAGDATKLTAGTYKCEALSSGTTDKTKMTDGCATGSNPSATSIFAPGGTIVLTTELEDSLGSAVDEAITVSLSDAAKKVLTATTFAGRTGAEKWYSIKDDAEMGEYTDGIVVSHGTGDKKLEQKLTFTIAGKATKFMLDKPAIRMPVALGASQLFTIKATDDNDNPPSDQPTVTFIVLAEHNLYTSPKTGTVKLTDGSGKFEVINAAEATQNGTGLIIVRDSKDKELLRHAFTFGGNTPPMGADLTADTILVGGTGTIPKHPERRR